MRTFEEWLEDEKLDEGWAKNLALGAALAGGAAGLYGSSGSNAPNQAPTTQSVQDEPRSEFNKAFHSKGREARRDYLQSKAQELRDAGRSSGSFVHGKLQGKSKDKTIQNKSTTSDAAASFLK